MVAVDAVLAHETLKNVETFRSQHIDTTFLEEVGAGIRCVLNQPCVHELLAHRLGHIAGHREGGCGGCGNDAGGFTRVWAAIGLLEFEVGEVLGSFITG